MTFDDPTTDRRTVLKATGAAALATTLAGCSGGDGGGDGGGTRSFDGWLESTSNYDGVADETGASEVTVEVGTEGNSGNNGFSPAAVKVSAGTTVVWEWTGKGSMHNVVAEDGNYESEMTSEAGFTFERTFDETGTSKYYCRPHETMGMKGVVVVE
jgi:halocyanin-like protein